MGTNWQEQIEYLSNQFEEIDGDDFYRYIFPCNEDKGEVNKDYSKPNAIYLYRDEADLGTRRRLRRRIMLNDTWTEDFMEYIEANPNTLCSGLAYRGRVNKVDKAQRMNALVFDLDGVGFNELKNLFWRFGEDPNIMRTLPMPTFLVSSGTGLHIYYVFDRPIDLFPNIKLQLKSLKYELTFRMWEYRSTSQQKEIQYQSINQGFRMVGSINSKYNIPIRAFMVGERVTLDYVNQYVREKYRVDVNKPFKPSKMTLEQAKESYPEWYQRVIVEGNKRPKKWDIKSKQGYALYEWWKCQIDSIRGGHRYFFLLCMAIYACKCDVPINKLKADMHEMMEELKAIPHENAMSEYDIESALEAYSKEYYNFTISDIEKLTDVRIERNKRNYRPQEQHIKIMSAVREVTHPEGIWRNMEGRPKGSGTKEQLVREYITDHPMESPTKIAKTLGISRTTVYKYL